MKDSCLAALRAVYLVVLMVDVMDDMSADHLAVWMAAMMALKLVAWSAVYLVAVKADSRD